MTRTGGGRFDPHEKNVYFIAGSMERIDHGSSAHSHLLVAVNEVQDGNVGLVESWIAKGHRVFLDSGIFNLTNEHARRHGVSMNEALALSPEDIDGFDGLKARYLSLASRLEANLWGYIELDQGGADNKRRTRAMLEAKGLRPIPVYHPLNDGWDYFDELASQYDRICLGNVVQAQTAERLRLVATAFERARKYPGLWIHVLGLTVGAAMYTYPLSSCDSSTWLSCVRWPGATRVQCNGMGFDTMCHEWQYSRDVSADHPRGNQKATVAAAYDSLFNTLNWREHRAAMSAEGLL